MTCRRPRALWPVFLAALVTAVAGAEQKPWQCRSLGTPKVLYLAGSPNSETFAELLRHVVPAEVAFAPLRYGDQEMHHLCDKPLEESKEDQAYVQKEGAAYFDGLVARMREFQVVIAQLPVRTTDKAEGDRLVATQKALADYARGGGKLVVINPGWEATFEGTPLDDVLPVKSGKAKSWVYSCGAATDHPLSRGIPLEVTGAHFYGPVYEPANEATCYPLTDNGKLTCFWHRALSGGGRVVHLFQVGGEKYHWRGPNASQYDPERPDDGAAWNAFYRRLLYGLAYGGKAFPVLVKVAAKPCRAGEALAASVGVENRTVKERDILVSLDVQHRRSPIVVRESKKARLGMWGSAALVFSPEVKLPCTDAWLLVKATVQDADGAAILSESATWVPYIHRVPLSLKTDKASYRPGEAVTATATWAADAEEGDYLPVAYVVDRSGRAMRRAALVASGGRSATAKLIMPDWGPEHVGCYWVTAVFSRDGQIAGLARAQVQLDQPWTMRERFDWSVWTWGGGGRFMDLVRDAGFNSLGCAGSCYTADRYAMRQYVEGADINTFSVTIDHDNWDAVRSAMNQVIDQHEKSGPDARSKSLVSLGEESGFKGGWGMRYYWPEDKAPAIPQKVFDDYLRERYAGRLDVLNQEWGTSFASFDDIPLEKAKVKSPGQVFVTAQAWEAMQKKGESKPVIPVDLAGLDPSTSLRAGPKQKYIGYSAPYWETYNFFDWYYQKYCDMATEIYRTRRNPVPLTIMSAPGGFYPKVDVYNFGGLGPFYPKEAALVANAIARRDYGDVPGFSAAMWAYFDLRSLWNCTVMSSILAGNTHIDYWVDVPLTFNADLTHTRASFWTKELRERLRPIEPILLHKRFAYTDGLGMLTGQQPLPKGILGQHFGSAIDCNAPIYSALEESGYMPKVVHARDLVQNAGQGRPAYSGVKVLVASHAQVLSAEEGKAIADFVKRGGLLISTPWLASCSPHGNVLTVYPAEETGLADLLGFKLLNTSQAVVREEHFLVHDRASDPIVIRGMDKVLDRAKDVTVLAAHRDTELILMRKVGKGQVVYLNFLYDWDNWWNSFHEPGREAYRKLIDAIIRSEGRVKAEYFIAFESAEPSQDNKGWWQVPLKSKPDPGESVPWWSSQLYSDPSGRIRYLAIFSDHRSPAIAATVRWTDPNVRVYDLLKSPQRRGPITDKRGPGEWWEIPTRQGASTLSLRPGEAAFWAILPRPAKELRVTAPRRVAPGRPVRVQVHLPRTDRAAVHGVTLSVQYRGEWGGAREHPQVSVSAPGGRAAVEIPTGFNDLPGEYQIVARESITRVEAETSFEVLASPEKTSSWELCPFPHRTGERWLAIGMTTEEFLGELRKLRALYEGTYAGFEAKWMLSYYLNVPFRPDNRHAIVRRLQRTDWRPHMGALAEAVRKGERFYILGEDTGYNDLGFRGGEPFGNPWPLSAHCKLRDQQGGSEFSAKLEGVGLKWVRLGKGVFVLGIGISVDCAAYHSSDFGAWHERLKKALKEIR